jgi:DNA-binding NarL/FixJ family response regulator
VTIRVLLAEDQDMVRAGLRLIVGSQADLEVVGEAADGEAAVALALQERPDVVLMDIRMPRLDGIEATRRLARTRADGRPAVVILTTYEADEYVFDALGAGASGFLLKASPPEDLIRAIRVAAAGDALLAPSVTRRLIEQFVNRPGPGGRQLARVKDLTERELDVLLEVARGRSNSEIASTLNVAETTVKTHIAHLLDKLELRDRVQAVILAYEAGLMGPR